VPSSTVVKAFNTVPAPTLLAADVDGASLDTFVASDDDPAKNTVINALQSTSLRALDPGVLANGRLLERLTASSCHSWRSPTLNPTRRGGEHG
jgi:predicted dinucleotide-binding enzyme